MKFNLVIDPATPTRLPSSNTLIPNSNTPGGTGVQYLKLSPGIPIKKYCTSHINQKKLRLFIF